MMMPKASIPTLPILVLISTATLDCAADRAASLRKHAVQEVEVPTSGATAEFARSACGRVITFSGRIFSRSHDGAVRPLLDAQFWYDDTSEGHRTEIDVTIDGQG